MDIKEGLQSIQDLNLNVSRELVEELRATADGVAEPEVEANIEEQDALVGMLLMSRLLHELAAHLGIKFEHKDVVTSAYFPSVREGKATKTLKLLEIEGDQYDISNDRGLLR